MNSRLNGFPALIAIDRGERVVYSMFLRAPFRQEVYIMPSYDFKCEKCKKKFTLMMTLSEFDKSKTRCPKCKSTRVQQQITAFQVVTSKKS